MNRLIKSFFIIMFLVVAFSNQAFGSPLFQYELWMQAQTSLDIGPLAIKGRIVNTGTLALQLGGQSSSVGLPATPLLTVDCDVGCQANKFGNGSIQPEDSINFHWLTGTITGDLSNRAGLLFEASFQLTPAGSNWVWTHGGFLPEILVQSEWVKGPADTNLPFNEFQFPVACYGVTL